MTLSRWIPLLPYDIDPMLPTAISDDAQALFPEPFKKHPTLIFLL